MYAYQLTIVFIVSVFIFCIMCAAAQAADDNPELTFDTVKHGHSEVIVSIKLPDGGKVTRVTEALDGRDGNTGSRVLKGYNMPDGTLVEVEILRNSDGSVTVRDLDNDNRGNDRHPVRMTPREFINWVDTHQSKK